MIIYKLNKKGKMRSLKVLVLVISISFLGVISGNCQFRKLIDAAKDGRDLFRNGNELLKEINNFRSTLKSTNSMKTEEFNKNVKVVKENDAKAVNSGKKTDPVYSNEQKDFTNIAWQPLAYFDGQLFPSMIISMANYKGAINGAEMNSVKSSALGFSFLSSKANIPIRWEIESTDKTFFDKANGNFVYDEKDKITYLMPTIPWNFSKLATQLSSTPLSLVYKIYDNNGNKAEQTLLVNIRSVNDCIYNYKGNSLDFLFSAFIQEQHPEIQNILKSALNTKIVSAFDGYQTSDSKSSSFDPGANKKPTKKPTNVSPAQEKVVVPNVSEGDESVLLQVAAIWKVLHDRGIQYSSTTITPSSEVKNLNSQYVRTFANSLKTNQANCVDGTVAIASILRAINISTVMVLTSRHCFLGFYTNSKKERIYYVETTMLSSDDIIKQAAPQQKKQAYVNQFLKACAVGKKEYDDYKSANDINLIDVDIFRQVVSPLPFN